MKLNQLGIDLIKSFEGCKLHAYKNPNDPVTIGWGNTTYMDNRPVKLGDTISQAFADELFTYKLNRVYVPLAIMEVSNLNDNQFSAIVSFVYNAGIKSLRKSQILALIDNNPFDPKIREVWQGQNVLKGSIYEKGLRRRRKAESDLYFKPIL